MKIAFSIFSILLLFNSHLHAQAIKVETVTITYDTIANTDIRKTVGPIQNDNKTAFIGFDSGFENDSVEVWLNNKVIASGLLNSKLLLVKAGGFQIPKEEKMQVTLIVKNKQKKFEVLFDKRFCVVHLHLDAAGNKLVWTYSNQVYTY